MSPPVSRDPRALAALVFVLALGLRLWYTGVAASGTLQNADSADYVRLAESLRAGGYAAGDTGMVAALPADLVRPPGYPLMLAATAPQGRVRPLRVALVQSVLGAAACAVLVLWVASFAGPVAGAIAGLILATEWATIVHTPLVIAETLCAAAVLAVLVAVVPAAARPPSGRRIAAAALALGAGVLVKPVVQMIVPVVLAYLLVVRRRAAVGLLVACALVVGPWVVRNRVRYGVWTVSPMTAINGTYLSLHPVDEQRRSAELEAIAHLDGPVDERIAALRARSLALLAENWAGTLALLPEAYARAAFGTARQTVATSPGGRALGPVLTVALPLAHIAVAWALATLGVLWAWRGPGGTRRLAMLLLGTAVALVAPAGSAGYSRFRVPAMPPIAVLAGLGGAEAWRRARASRDPRPQPA